MPKRKIFSKVIKIWIKSTESNLTKKTQYQKNLFLSNYKLFPTEIKKM